jgi:two-component system, chemotaxis family, chemotaxis protein CheY
VLAIVIDDSTAMRRIIRGIVAQLGFAVYEAGNGREALDLLDEIPTVPDVALIDWNMPEMNGLEFIRAVRRREECREMCLMMVTTESEYSQIVRALAAGAHDYVIKPFTPDAIGKKLAYMGLVDLPAEVA